jgi:hypothetical protein
MNQKPTLLAVLTLAAALPVVGRTGADEWDIGGDVNSGSRNALFHGSEQVHDLGPASDQDWYRIETRPWSSYQMVVDGMTGDLDLVGTSLQLVDSSNALVADAQVQDFGGTLSLVWSNGGGPPALRHFVRVRGASCGTTCGNSDRYRIRFFDTTYTIPRFNNSGTQSTVLVVQNATNRSCVARYALLNAAGALVGSTQRTIPVRGLDVVSTAALAPNESGSVRLAHDCGFGGLSGKAVSVEPATGLTFDTQMVHRPH